MKKSFILALCAAGALSLGAVSTANAQSISFGFSNHGNYVGINSGGYYPSYPAYPAYQAYPTYPTYVAPAYVNPYPVYGYGPTYYAPPPRYVYRNYGYNRPYYGPRHHGRW